MTALIKSSAAAASAVRTFGFEAIAAPIGSGDSPQQELEARVAELVAELARREETHVVELEVARAKGASAALAARSDAEARALDALKEALGAADASWRERLASWDTLSAGLARSVLERIFADPSDRVEEAVNLVRGRLGRLDLDSLVRIRVSASDFGDQDALAAASRAIGAKAELAADEALSSGDCVIDLKLGHVEVGAGAQWARVSSLLDRLEREGTGA